MSDDVAEMPGELRSLLDRLEEGEYEMAETLRAIWENPELHARGDVDQLRFPGLDARTFLLLRVAIAFGAAYEQAYPDGYSDHWPVPLDDRDWGDGGDE